MMLGGRVSDGVILLLFYTFTVSCKEHYQAIFYATCLAQSQIFLVECSCFWSLNVEYKTVPERYKNKFQCNLLKFMWLCNA
jgi:hypothetical protein